MIAKFTAASLGLVLGLGTTTAVSGSDPEFHISQELSRSGFIMENGLEIPAYDPAKGRELFATKGCVVCHSINGVGGQDAPEFSAEYMDHPMNAFDFAAKMWRGASAMIMMQESEIGKQIELSGGDLFAIIAFVHDAEEQAKFSLSDVPHDMRHFMMPDFEEKTSHEIMLMKVLESE